MQAMYSANTGCEASLAVDTYDGNFTNSVSETAVCSVMGTFLNLLTSAPWLSFGKSAYSLGSCYNFVIPGTTKTGSVATYVPFGTNCPGKCTQSTIGQVNAIPCAQCTPYYQCTDLIKGGTCTGFYLCAKSLSAGFCR
jgi:hypothetical protein